MAYQFCLRLSPVSATASCSTHSPFLAMAKQKSLFDPQEDPPDALQDDRAGTAGGPAYPSPAPAPVPEAADGTGAVRPRPENDPPTIGRRRAWIGSGAMEKAVQEIKERDRPGSPPASKRNPESVRRHRRRARRTTRHAARCYDPFPHLPSGTLQRREIQSPRHNRGNPNSSADRTGEAAGRPEGQDVLACGFRRSFSGCSLSRSFRTRSRVSTRTRPGRRLGEELQSLLTADEYAGAEADDLQRLLHRASHCHRRDARRPRPALAFRTAR